jgi:purine-binding chemotaxis protein CheW
LEAFEMPKNDALQIVNFVIGEVNYGVPVEQVREVRDMQAVTPVPGAPPYVVGVTNLRGQIITIVDFRKRLGLPSKSGGVNEKIIIVEMGEYAVGVVVDEVTDVLTIPWKDIERHMEVATTMTDCVIGIGKIADKLIVILDLARLILKGVEEAPVVNIASSTEVLEKGSQVG